MNDCNKASEYENYSTINTTDNMNEAVNSSTNCNNLLYPINNLPVKYKHIFSNYVYFDKIQTQSIGTILYSDNSVVVSSTGSGTVVIFELAIIRFLESLGKFSNNLENSKIIYVSPIKTLCSERYENWKNKFSIYGLKCVEIIGNTEFTDDLYLFNNYQLIITTPEKWDSLTKILIKFKYKVDMVKLFLIDEIHSINESNRGAIFEAIISRMKIITKNVRFVATCATLSNIEDIAKWLNNDQNRPAYYLKSNEDERPATLQKIVLGYNFLHTGFKFDINLTYKLKSLIKQYSNGRPTLIFCPTRKSVEYTCNTLIKEITIELSDDKKRNINEFLKEINNNKIKELIKIGIGCLHAGMSTQERCAIEKLFRIGYLYILIASSTIAIGVDLFAHLVIIKSTECYTFNGYKEYNESQILQMIGRAGRSRFNTLSTVIIMTKTTMKARYDEILNGNQFVESHLHKHLIEHLNAEIFLGTIHNITTTMNWIKSTFLYVRACQSPIKYGIIGTHNINEIENRLQNLCLTNIKILACTGLIHFNDENNIIASKPEGEIMAKYSINIKTIKLFMSLKGNEVLNDIIRILSYSKEFECIKFRNNEKEKLNILNKNKLSNSEVIRFPIQEGINTRESKINCLLQATLGTLNITESSLLQDANKIILISTRLTKALREITFRGTKFNIARVSCILAKCVSTKLWEQSKFVSKLIPKIGPVLSKYFVLNGITTLQSIRDTHPRDLERFVNRLPPFGNHIHKFIKQIPKYKVWLSFNECLYIINLKISLINYENIFKPGRFYTVSILVGDSDNRLLKVQQIRNEEFIEKGGGINMDVSLEHNWYLDKIDYTVTVCLISDQWVGIDVEILFKPSNREEHIKESISEENCFQKSPLKTIMSPQPIKKQATKNSKYSKKDKIQMNIEKYLCNNVYSKDQDPKIINKLYIEENKDNMESSFNESRIPKLKIASESIETPTNSQNNDQIYEFNKSRKHNLNNYFCYNELINDDVFSNLFVTDDNLCVINKKFESVVENICFKQCANKTKYLENRVQSEYIEPTQLKCLREYSIDKLENNNPIADHKNWSNVPDLKSNRLIHKNENLLISKDQLMKNKENVNPYKSVQIKKRYPFGILHEEFVSKQLKNTRTPLTNKTPCNTDNSVYNDHLKNNHAHNIIRTEFSSSCSSSLSGHDPSSNNTIDRKSEIKLRSQVNFPVVPIPAASTAGRLSQRIKANLNVSSDFYIRSKKLFETVDDCCNRYGAIEIGNSESQTKQNTFSVNSQHRRNGKRILDKYFRATKISRLRLNDLNAVKLI